MTTETTHFVGRLTVTRATKTTPPNSRYANEPAFKPERQTIEELDVTVKADTLDGLTTKLKAATRLLAAPTDLEESTDE